MDFFDELKERVSAATSGIQGDIKAYLDARVTDPLVKIGQPQMGNLSAAEIAAGKTGQPSQTAAPGSNAAANMNSAQASQISRDSTKYFAILAAVGLGLLFFAKSRRK